MIDLRTAPTPNGRKASATLEELQLPYWLPRAVPGAHAGWRSAQIV